MIEKIISITPFEDNDCGYKVLTNKQEIVFAIDNSSNCCEEWGYFSTNDDIQYFIGSKLIEISTTNSELDTKVFLDVCKSKGHHLDEGEMMFVNLTTSKGVLQFVVYNQHNGYYSHAAYIKSNKLSEVRYI